MDFHGGKPPNRPPFVSVNLATAASIDDDVTDPIVEEEAKRIEKELARKMQKMHTATDAGRKESTDEAGGPEECAGQRHRGSTDSEGAELGPFQTLSGSCSSGHVISSPYELSHYPIEILEHKTALQRQISNRWALGVWHWH